MRRIALAPIGQVLGSCAVVLVACSSGAPSQAPGNVDTCVGEPRSAVALVDARAQLTTFARREWRAVGRGFSIDAGARDLPSVRASFASTHGDRLELTHAGRRLIVRDASIADRLGRVDDGRVVFDASASAPDVVWMADATRVESFHVLRTPASHAGITWSLELPPGSRGVVDDHRGGADVLDEVGDPLFHVPRPFAIDAHGVRRDARLAIEGTSLRVTLDAEGLVYPILLDPAVEAAVWQFKSTVPFGVSAAGTYLMGFSGTLGACAYAPSAPGYSTPTNFGCWKGSSWQTYGSLCLDNAAMTTGPGGQLQILGTSCGGYPALLVAPAAATWGYSYTWADENGCHVGPHYAKAIAFDADRAKHVILAESWYNAYYAGGSWNCGGSKALAETATAGGFATCAYSGTSCYSPDFTPNPRGFVYFPPLKQSVLLTGTGLRGWDGTKWTALPSAPATGSLVYDPASKRMYVVGMTTASFDGTTWRTVSTSGPSSIAAASWDPGRKRGVAVTTGQQTWEFYLRGNTCGTAADCDTANCVDGVCCEQAACGTCQACNTTATPGQCGAVTNADDPDTCTGLKSCDPTGACKLRPGQTCGTASQCLSGFCVDGVCCDGACTGRCQTCLAAFNASGVDGTCGPVKDGADPDGECPDDGAASCRRDGFCDGVGACRQYEKGTSCGAMTCSGSRVTGSTCDGLGVCASDPTGVDCSPFACSAGKCAATCTTNAECASGSWCSAGSCTSQLAQGDACTKDASCPTGHCVDGVCCDSACTGQCEACDVTGVIGVCTPVAGLPHGIRSPCSDGGGDVCKVRECDGVAGHGGSCQGFKNGITVSCGAASCNIARYAQAPMCDGAGACPATHESSCVPYACDANGCKGSCASDVDCAATYSCNAGKCEAITTTCSGDGLSEGAADGSSHSCAPYLCKNLRCRTRCADGTDCAPGNRCNDEASCVTSDAVASADAGGCGFGRTTGERRVGVAVAGLALLLMVGRRRKRALGAPRRCLRVGAPGTGV